MARKVRPSPPVSSSTRTSSLNSASLPRSQKPVSGKARKAQLQTKRAVKKASVTPVPFPADVVSHPVLAALLSSNGSTASSSSSHAKPHTGSRPERTGDRIGHRFRTAEQRERDEVHGARMALESRFVRLPKHIADVHAQVAATDKLVRPVADEMGVLKPEDLVPTPERAQDGEVHPAAAAAAAASAGAGEFELTCPKRPKWNYNQTKREVEKNEGASSFPCRRPSSPRPRPLTQTFLSLPRAEGIFKKWLETTDDILVRAAAPPLHEDGTLAGLPGSPTFFERNLNVWRQLWRTTEVSDILCVLIGAFPLTCSSIYMCASST